MTYFLGVSMDDGAPADWPYSFSLGLAYADDEDGRWASGMGTMSGCADVECPAGIVVRDVRPLLPGESRAWMLSVDDLRLTSGQADLTLNLSWPFAADRQRAHYQVVEREVHTCIETSPAADGCWQAKVCTGDVTSDAQ